MNCYSDNTFIYLMSNKIYFGIVLEQITKGYGTNFEVYRVFINGKIRYATMNYSGITALYREGTERKHFNLRNTEYRTTMKL